MIIPFIRNYLLAKKDWKQNWKIDSTFSLNMKYNIFFFQSYKGTFKGWNWCHKENDTARIGIPLFQVIHYLHKSFDTGLYAIKAINIFYKETVMLRSYTQLKDLLKTVYLELGYFLLTIMNNRKTVCWASSLNLTIPIN